jgi:hypothetical protein
MSHAVVVIANHDNERMKTGSSVNIIDKGHPMSDPQNIAHAIFNLVSDFISQV